MYTYTSKSSKEEKIQWNPRQKTTLRDYTKNLPSADPVMKGHLLSRDTFTHHRLIFNHKCPVIRVHLLNADSRQANHNIFCPLPGLRRQFASCEFPVNINFYSGSADFIDLLQNSLCGLGIYARGRTRSNASTLFFNTREC